MRHLPLAVLLPALLLFGAGGVGAQPPAEERRPAPPDGEVEIVGQSAPIRVIGWDRPEVAVSGQGPPGAPPRLSGAGGRTRVDAGEEGGRRGGAGLEIRVPRRSRVRLRTLRAPVRVEALGGTLTAESFDGPISIARGPTDVTAKTTNGSVDVDAAAARLDLETVNGSLHVRGAARALRARTVNGPITIKGDDGAGEADRPFGQVALTTISGPITFDAALAPEAALTAESVNGPIRIAIPAATPAHVVLDARNGRARSRLAPTAAPAGAPPPGDEAPRTLTLDVGPAGPRRARITARAVNGDITLDARPPRSPSPRSPR
jgi:hypothetical protein